MTKPSIKWNDYARFIDYNNNNPKLQFLCALAALGLITIRDGQ